MMNVRQTVVASAILQMELFVAPQTPVSFHFEEYKSYFADWG
jgi:hypothetical protein